MLNCVDTNSQLMCHIIFQAVGLGYKNRADGPENLSSMLDLR